MSRRWRITGISTAAGGLQWEYLDGDAEIARRVISILEDKRMLWEDFAYEVPNHVLESASQARDDLTEQISTKGISPELASLLKEIRKLLANFMTTAPLQDNGFAVLRPEPFFVALGGLRAAVGERLALLTSRYKLDVDDDLRSIIPDTGAWFFEAFDA
ncbi:DUF6650 family protein [Oerskovia enterophila]|uniref:DUF6650 family protein n=1 Tax=Oerskovia enterophila TaxID=43678 RepID=UPI0038220D4A